MSATREAEMEAAVRKWIQDTLNDFPKEQHRRVLELLHEVASRDLKASEAE